MTTTALPDGIYRIETADGGQPQYLTREESGAVTILLPNAQSDPRQRWRIINDDNGNIILEVPGFVPGNYLTYKGAPEKPQEGDRIIYRPDPQRPLNAWHVVSGNIRVAGSDLGIGLTPLPVFPPLLELRDEEHQLKWAFVRADN